jgi:hypothetical protein
MNSVANKAALAFALAVGVCAAGSAKDFEGLAILRIEAKGNASESVGYIKGEKMKTVPSAAGQALQAMQAEMGIDGYPIIDFKAKKVSIVSTKDKYYLDMALDPFIKAIDQKAVKVKRSGKSEVIAGHEAEEWVLDEAADGVRISLWATKDYSLGINIFVSMQKLFPVEGLALGRAAKAVIAQGLMPLKATASGADGVTTLAWEVRELTEKKLADSELAIPAGYDKMSDVLKKNRKSKGR